MPFPDRLTGEVQKPCELGAGIEEGLAPLEEAGTAGDPACLAHLVRPSGGAVTTEGHLSGCQLMGLDEDGFKRDVVDEKKTVPPWLAGVPRGPRAACASPKAGLAVCDPLQYRPGLDRGLNRSNRSAFQRCDCGVRDRLLRGNCSASTASRTLRARCPSGKVAGAVLVDVWRPERIHLNGDRYLLIKLAKVTFAQHIHKFCANGSTDTVVFGRPPGH